MRSARCSARPVSKLFTWTAVMQLVEQGKLNLDADLNQYLDFKIPQFNGKGAIDAAPCAHAHDRVRGDGRATSSPISGKSPDLAKVLK